MKLTSLAILGWDYTLQYVVMNLLKPLKKRSLQFPSSVFKNTYYDTGTFIVYDIKNLLENKINKNLDFSPYILPSFKGVDVDTLDDWNLALFYYKNLK